MPSASTKKKTVKKVGTTTRTTIKKSVKSPAKSTAATKSKATKSTKAASPVKAKPKAKRAGKATAKTKTAKPAKKIAAPKAAVKKKAPAKKVAVVAKKPVKKLSQPEILRDIALKILDERQAEDIVTMDMRGRSIVSDFVIVATGRSGRQQAAIADYLTQAFNKNGAGRVRIEGLAQGDWVLFDGGDVIVHLFKPDVRAFYKIEDIGSRRASGE